VNVPATRLASWAFVAAVEFGTNLNGPYPGLFSRDINGVGRDTLNFGRG